MNLRLKNCRWNVLLYVSSKKQDCTTWLLHNDKLKLKHKYMYSCPSLGDKELLGIEEIKNLIKHSFENVLTCTRSLCTRPAHHLSATR